MNTSPEKFWHEESCLNPFELFLIIVLLIVAFFISVTAPFAHNPDGNYYYGTALRISRGEFAASVEGLYSPLISWAMAVPIWCGMSVPGAFRAVNFLAFVATLFATLLLCKRMKMGSSAAAIVLFLVGLHLGYFTVVIISSDLLAAPFYLFGCLLLTDEKTYKNRKRLMIVGIMGALAYYAKAIELPIFVLAIFLIGALRYWKKISSLKESMGAVCIVVATCALLCLPWIGTLSYKYKSIIISVQELVTTGKIERLKYSPLSPLNYYTEKNTVEGNGEKSTGKSSKINFLKKKLNVVLFSLGYLSKTTSGLLFGNDVWWIYLGSVLVGIFFMIRNLKREFFWAYLLIFAVSQFGGYLSVWGPYLRYYFPVLPLMHIFFVYGAIQIKKLVANHGKNFKLLNERNLSKIITMFYFIVILGMVRTTSVSVLNDWSIRDNEVVEYALTLSLLRNKHGVITGNFMDPYGGHISYLLKREYWNGLNPKQNESETALREKLINWKISQVLWFGKIYKNLENVKGITRHGPFKKNKIRFFVYDFK